MTFLTRASLANRAIVGLITIAIALLGLVAMGSLRQELMPPVKYPGAFISVQSPGLAPEQMAEVATEPVEQSLRSVAGITEVTSVSSTGSAQISVTWPFELDADETERAIRSAVDGAKAALPQGARIDVMSGSSSDMPAMMFTAGSAGDPVAFADQLEQTVLPALRSVDGVREAALSGREEQRVEVAIRPADLERLKVEAASVLQALQANAAVQPAGQVEGAEGAVSVTVGPGLESIEAIQALPVQVQEGSVRVGDVADVSLQSVAATSISRVNGKPALTIQITPGSGANVVDISHGVQAQLDGFTESLGAEFVTLFDQAPYIEQSIHDLSVEGALGLLFAVIVIFAFLRSWRSTVIAAVSIPLSLLITMIGLWWSDNTLNILTLGALTIAIGRVVDDSIVVIENISRHAERRAPTPADIVASVKQVAGAITASTLTTVAVFLPIAFVSGLTGQLFRPFAITVTIALLASLVVALTIVPVLAYWFLKNRAAKRDATADASTAANVATEPDADHDAPLDAAAVARAEMRSPEDRLQRSIMPALGATRRHPFVTLGASLVVLVATLALSVVIPTDFLGESGQQSLTLEQTPKDAVDLTTRAEAAEPVERALGKVEGVRDVVAAIPAQSSTAGEPARINYDILLEEGAKADAVRTRVERALEPLGDPEQFELTAVDTSGFGGGGIELRVLGNDPVALREASDALVTSLEGEPGVEKATSSLSGEQPVVRVVVDPAKAAALGFDQQQIAQAIDAALSGTPAGTLMLEGRERDIVIRTSTVTGGAAGVAELLLPVTPKQTAAAQKAAFDKLKAEQEQQAESAQAEAANALERQIADAQSARGELRDQLAAMRGQLAALRAAPIVPAKPGTPQEEANAAAVRERQEQLASLESAIAQTEQGIAASDEQVEQLREAQSDAAEQRAEAERMEQEQTSAGELRGTPVRVADVAAVTEERTAPSVSRIGGEREVAISVTPKSGALDAANAAVTAAMAEVTLPSGVHYEVTGVSAEQDEAFAQLGLAMLAAIVLVLFVMIGTFRNLRQPMILLVSVPFAATGALLGLFLTGTPLGLPALIGLLMLIGIVVTNAIVLIDLVNKLREGGATLEDAVRHGTRLRLRPILMTAAATIFALLPMAFGLTGGGVFISKPLAIVVIGGLISSTLLTLVLVPILYLLFERGRDRRMARRAERRERRAARRDGGSGTGSADGGSQDGGLSDDGPGSGPGTGVPGPGLPSPTAG
ncbi:efflux RND transporter permease subunit [Agromyces soli]|uniref:Efflux RND transporter permease subunit n=1 Tax=Agromyces soli TaxID=659012 RepID=A0ABY4AYS7_9MICO|nr:efflux RND transporter permease subunit [Agromyces soli]UOE26988.1 efflux RND transporter permease subunit [Agromyces soli]